MRKPYNQMVPAVDEAARILFFMASQGRREQTLTSICEGVGIHKPKGLSILNTLAAHGLTSKDEDVKTWSLGPSLLALSQAVLDNAALGSLAEPHLVRLAAASKAAALLGVVSGEWLVIVSRQEARDYHGVTIRTGHRYPLGWGAHGELFVAHKGETGAERFSSLRFGRDVGKMQRGINAVAAPVYGTGLAPVGCLLVVGTFPEEEVDSIGAFTADAAEELSRKYAAVVTAGGQFRRVEA